MRDDPIWKEVMGSVVTDSTVTKPVHTITQNKIWGDLGAHYVILTHPKLWLYVRYWQSNPCSSFGTVLTYPPAKI